MTTIITDTDAPAGFSGTRKSHPVFEGWLRFSGRRNRKSYLLAILFMMGIAMAGGAVAGAIAGTTQSPAALVFIAILGIPFGLCGFAIGSQRCRDIGWTGWAILVPGALQMGGGWMAAVSPDPAVGGAFAGVLLLIAIGVSLWIFFAPSQPGENRYGPSPIE